MKIYTPLKYLILKKPKVKTFYAVKGGAWLGKFLLFINPADPNNRTNGYYDVLAVGNGRGDAEDGFENMKVPVEAFAEGIKKNIIEEVEKIPNEHYNILHREWYERVADFEAEEQKKVIPFPKQKKTKKKKAKKK